MSHINNFKNRYSLWKSLRHCTWTSLHEVVWSAILPVFPLLHFDPLAGRSPSEISEVLADGLFSCNSLKKTFNFIDQIYLKSGWFYQKERVFTTKYTYTEAISPSSRDLSVRSVCNSSILSSFNWRTSSTFLSLISAFSFSLKQQWFL